MRITVLRNLGHGWPAYREGQTVEADEQVAKQLLGQGLAVLVAPAKPTAVPVIAAVEKPQAPAAVAETPPADSKPKSATTPKKQPSQSEK